MIGVGFLEELIVVSVRCFHNEYECVDESSRNRTNNMRPADQGKKSR